MGKLTIEDFVNKAKLIHGDKYDYSKVVLKGVDSPITIICPRHGEFSITPYKHLNRHQGCRLCARQFKSTEEYIQEANLVHNNFYLYSDTHYTTSRNSIEVVCPQHGKFLVRADKHLDGIGCPMCQKERNREQKKAQFIQKCKDKFGDKFDYLLVDYQTLETKVKIICPKHGVIERTPRDILHSDYGCPECGKENGNLNRMMTKEEFVGKAQLVHEDKYDYSKVDLNHNDKVCIICPEHGEFWQTPYSHLQGSGCPKCGRVRIKNALSMNKETFIEYANKVHNNKYNYEKVAYDGNQNNVYIICPEHGGFWQTPDHHLRGQGCPKCVHHQSKAENEIIEFLKQFLSDSDIIENDRKILDGKEIDILLPRFRIGIEFNGLYWHSTRTKIGRNYHKDKMMLANSKGYRLIQIFEDEWVEHKEIILNKLRHFVNADYTQEMVGARKCTVRTITNGVAKDFLTKYHIQGYIPSTVYLGAYYNDKLVGVMTFTEEKEKMWNLTRFATDTSYRLSGLASKMFVFFKNKYEFIEIKSFLDLRWNQSLNGNTVYDKLGFSLDKIENPDYRYVINNKRIHKFRCRKQILSKKYGLPLTMTESEMTQQLGFERIYDCGLAKYTYKIST